MQKKKTLQEMKREVIVTASGDNTLKLWDLETGRCLRVMDGHTSDVGSVAFNHNGIFIVSASADETLRIWNTMSGACLQVLRGHEASVCLAALITRVTHCLR